jgi:hypothetical protein
VNDNQDIDRIGNLYIYMYIYICIYIHIYYMYFYIYKIGLDVRLNMSDLNQSNAIHKLLIQSKSDEANYIGDINTDEFPLQNEDVYLRKGSFRLHLPLGGGQGPPRVSGDPNPSLLNPNPDSDSNGLSQYAITPSTQDSISGRDNDIKSSGDKFSQKSDISNISVCNRSEISVHWESADEKDYKGDKTHYDHDDYSVNTPGLDLGLGLGLARRQDSGEAKKGMLSYICVTIYVHI